MTDLVSSGCCERPFVCIDAAMRVGYERFEPRERPKHGCSVCGLVPGGRVRLDTFTIAKLRGRVALSDAAGGGATKLGLLPLEKIVKSAREAIVPTDADGRIEPDLSVVRINPVLREDLRRRLAEKMAVRLEKPRAVDAYGLSHKAILHIGLSYKFVDDEHLDRAHVRYARYVVPGLKAACEVWLDADKYDARGVRRVYRVIAALAGPSRVEFMQVVVEEDSHIVRTAYVMSPQQVEATRAGVPIALRWVEL